MSYSFINHLNYEPTNDSQNDERLTHMFQNDVVFREILIDLADDDNRSYENREERGDILSDLTYNEEFTTVQKWSFHGAGAEQTEKGACTAKRHVSETSNAVAVVEGAFVGPQFDHCAEYFGKPTTTLTQQGSFGGYRLVNLLGEGSHGKVYSARARLNSDDVAIKLIPKERYDDKAAWINLKREFDLLMTLNHVNVISCKDFIHGENHIGLVTPLCFQDLQEYTHLAKLYNNDLSWNFIRQMAIGLFSGLAYLHGNDIIHLDIKPENILIRRNASPAELIWSDFCICDLGMCHQGESAGEPITPNGISGTPGFIAPELCTHPGDFDGRAADIFSAGVTVIDVVYGPSQAWMDAYILLGCDVDAGAKEIWRLVDEFSAAEGRVDDWFHRFVCCLVAEYPPSRPCAIEVTSYLC